MPRKRRRIVDLSYPIEPSMPVFPLYPKPITLAWTQTPVHPFDSEILHCVTHTGTHMDAPSHFLKGTDSIEDIGLDRCVAPGAVVDLRSVGAQGLIGRELPPPWRGKAREEAGEGRCRPPVDRLGEALALPPTS